MCDLSPVRSGDPRNSSTGFVDRVTLIRNLIAVRALECASVQSELPYLPRRSEGQAGTIARPVQRSQIRERNESGDYRRVSNENPNRKDRHPDGSRPLLIGSNAPRIRRFADSPRHRSVTADGQVMDRGAERAAGGYDAI